MRATDLFVWPSGKNRGPLVVSATFLATAMGVGSGVYSFGLFIGPLEDTFDWSRMQISAGLSLLAVSGLVAPVVGRLMDRHGARPIMVASLVALGLSYSLRPLMTELWHWYALWLLHAISFPGTTLLPAGRLVGLWFRKTRGRMMGFVMMGNNFGGLIFPPITAVVLAVWSWQSAYIMLASLAFGIAAFTLVAVREPPTGGQFKETSRTTNEGRRSVSAPALTGWTVRQTLHSKAFYAIALSMLLGTFTYSTVLPHMIAHLRAEGMSVTGASLALSVLAAVGMIGKLAFGYLAERITARYALMISLMGQVLWLTFILNPSSALVIWTSVPLYGLFMGAYGALLVLIVQESFGILYFGTIMGLIDIVTVVSAGLGPILAGLSFDLTESYRVAFITVMAMLSAGALILTQARPREPIPAH